MTRRELRQVHSLLREIEENVKQSVLAESPDLRMSISVGGAYHEPSLAEAIEKADKEMYRNKLKRK